MAIKKKIGKALRGAETITAVTAAIALSAYVWWPLGPVAAGIWYLKRRWRKNKSA